MRLSIVMTYYNRKKQLYRTLQSIKASSHSSYEVIIVDDGSDEEERIEDLVQVFPFIRLIRLEKKDKWYSNCCIPFNLGIANAFGEVIVLQNPECFHVGDVLAYIDRNISDSVYLTMATYSINEDLTNGLLRNPIFEEDKLRNLIYALPQSRYSRWLGWYNHAVHHPTYFHFCSAITRVNMDKLGGFDERYALGIAYDDVELVERITRLGLEKRIVEEVMVVHQFHSKKTSYSSTNYRAKHVRNKELFDAYTRKETDIKKKNRYAGIDGT